MYLCKGLVKVMKALGVSVATGRLQDGARSRVVGVHKERCGREGKQNPALNREETKVKERNERP